MYYLVLSRQLLLPSYSRVLPSIGSKNSLLNEHINTKSFTNTNFKFSPQRPSIIFHNSGSGWVRLRPRLSPPPPLGARSSREISCWSPDNLRRKLVLAAVISAVSFFRSPPIDAWIPLDRLEKQKILPLSSTLSSPWQTGTAPASQQMAQTTAPIDRSHSWTRPWVTSTPPEHQIKSYTRDTGTADGVCTLKRKEERVLSV